MLRIRGQAGALTLRRPGCCDVPFGGLPILGGRGTNEGFTQPCSSKESSWPPSREVLRSPASPALWLRPLARSFARAVALWAGAVASRLSSPISPSCASRPAACAAPSGPPMPDPTRTGRTSHDHLRPLGRVLGLRGRRGLRRPDSPLKAGRHGLSSLSEVSPHRLWPGRRSPGCRLSAVRGHAGRHAAQPVRACPKPWSALRGRGRVRLRAQLCGRDGARCRGHRQRAWCLLRGSRAISVLAPRWRSQSAWSSLIKAMTRRPVS